MKKAVDVIERTLEKDKKDFITVCKIGEVCSIVSMAIFIVGAVAVAIMGFMTAAGVSDGSTEFASPEAAVTTIINTLMLITAIIALKFSAEVFGELKTAETPFRYDIADKIKGAGIVLVVGTFVCSALEFVKGVLIGSGVMEESGAVDSIVSTDCAVFGVVLIALAYVFNYGCQLQKEADETL